MTDYDQDYTIPDEELENDPISDPDIEEDSFWVLGDDGELHKVMSDEEEDDYVENTETW